MSKDFRFGQDARNNILKGAEILAKSVGCTLGPAGKLNVIQQRGNALPKITKDGVSVAKASLPLRDPFQNMGAQMVYECAQKTCDSCGDGTTSSSIIAEKLLSEGSKLVAAGHNSVNIKRGIDFAVDKIVEELKKMAKPIKSEKEIEQIGTVSANGDSEIGSIISRALQSAGSAGIITVQESQKTKTELLITNGYQFDRGYLSQHFVTNEKGECVLENPLILLAEGDVSNVSVILPVLQKCSESLNGKPLVIIASDICGDALPTLIVNHLKKSFLSCAVKSPGFGDRRKEMLRDIAILTGAQVVSEELGRKLENFDISWLGHAKKMVATKNSCTIVEGAGDTKDIERRVIEIRNAIAACTEAYDREKMEERLSKLSCVAVTILAADFSESALHEKRDRIDDSLNATKSAIEEGIVCGAGVALLRASLILDKMDIPEELRVGAKLVRKAAETPLVRIVENAGGDAAMVRIQILNNPDPFYGYNSRTGTFENLVESGVIDPVKVVRCALQNAASVAGLVLMTECMIAEEPEEPKSK